MTNLLPIAIATLLSSPDTLFFAVLIALILWALLVRKTFMGPTQLRVNVSDWLWGAFVLIQFGSIFTATSSTNTVHYLLPLSSASCAYFIARLTLSGNGVLTLLRTVSVVGGIAGAVAVWLDTVSIARLEVFPATALSSLHANMSFAGGQTRNDNVQILFLLLIYAVAGWLMEEGRTSLFVWPARISVTLLLTGMVLGFSRSAYVALGVFLSAIVFLVVRGRVGQRRRLLAVCSVMIGVPVLYAFKIHVVQSVMQIVSIFHTASQQRSAVGRLTIWADRISLAMSHPWLGWGWYSDGMVSLASIKRHSETAFTAHAYNALIEVLVSGGVVSLAVFCAFLGAVFITALKNQRALADRPPLQKIAPMVIGIGLLCALARDLTYDSIVLNGFCLSLFVLGCAMVVTLGEFRNVEGPVNGIGRLHHPGWGIAVAAMAAIIFNGVLARQETAYASGTRAMARGDWSQARSGFDDALRGPWKNALFFAARGLAEAREAIPSTQDAIPGQLVLEGEAREELERARADYLQALRYSPDDASLWCNLAWVDLFLGDKPDAGNEFQHALHSDPYDAMSHLGLALFSESTHSEEIADREYSQALQLWPRTVKSPLWRKLNSRNPEMASNAFSDAFLLLRHQSGSPIARARLAALEQENGEAELAYADYTEVVATLPNLSYPWLGLAYEELNHGDEGEAEIDLRRAVAVDASNMDAKLVLSSILYSHRDASSVALYRQTMSIMPRSVHSERVNRIYHEQSPAFDDVLPSGLLESIQPSFKLVPICDEAMFSAAQGVGANLLLLRTRLEQQRALCSAN